MIVIETKNKKYELIVFRSQKWQWTWAVSRAGRDLRTGTTSPGSPRSANGVLSAWRSDICTTWSCRKKNTLPSKNCFSTRNSTSFELWPISATRTETRSPHLYSAFSGSTRRRPICCRRWIGSKSNGRRRPAPCSGPPPWRRLWWISTWRAFAPSFFTLPFSQQFTGAFWLK